MQVHTGFEMELLDIGNRVGMDVRQDIRRSYRRLHQNPYHITFTILGSHSGRP